MSDSTSDAVNVSLAVVWQGSTGKQDARMSEISMEGCFIDSKVQARALGDKVEFKVRLPSGPWVSLQGELVSEDYPIGFGLRFSNLSYEDKRLLAEVVIAHGGNPGELPPMSAPVEKETEPAPARPRVLVADDDALTLRMVSAIVQTEGYEAVAVSDGRQALGVLAQDANFSAAIFDMTMPHLQGLDLILYMKADERLRGIPIGMISAEQDPKVWDDSVTAGASVFLPKPFTPPQVQMMLRMLTSKAPKKEGH
ncbi:MAG TPA: response regulator [Pyrinomonadaceae bacterium]|jgi:CheY-like chemotaxis protein|nr:response regulator [Pyrinomonadaceae bacterium]